MISVPESFSLIAELFIKRGRLNVKDLAVEKIGNLELTLNGSSKEESGIPPYHCKVMWNGWPAGIIGPGGGHIVNSRYFSEDILINILKRELKDNGP